MFTTCYELMDYINELFYYKAPITDEQRAELKELYNLLHKDWKEFNKNPFWLLERLKHIEN